MPRLRMVDVLFHVCSCGQHHQGPVCPEERCREPFDPGRMRLISRSWLVVVADEILYHVRTQVVRCENGAAHYRIVRGQHPGALPLQESWDNLVPLLSWQPSPGRIVCPLCGSQASPRVSRLWKRSRASLVQYPEWDRPCSGDDQESS